MAKRGPKPETSARRKKEYARQRAERLRIIKRMLAEGHSYRVIGDAIGVSRQRVQILVSSFLR